MHIQTHIESSSHFNWPITQNTHIYVCTDQIYVQTQIPYRYRYISSEHCMGFVCECVCVNVYAMPEHSLLRECVCVCVCVQHWNEEEEDERATGVATNEHFFIQYLTDSFLQSVMYISVNFHSVKISVLVPPNRQGKKIPKSIQL